MRVRRSATRTLLLDGLDDLAQGTEGLEDWPTEPPDEGLGELVELPVTYEARTSSRSPGTATSIATR